ncbi:hypothetical protein DFH06DRAFT_1119199 [Mycena polygramma]|nr:hypothetical protein DFH06DRAFT_1119199 [Mycena polygramma]
MLWSTSQQHNDTRTGVPYHVYAMRRLLLLHWVPSIASTSNTFSLHVGDVGYNVRVRDCALQAQSFSSTALSIPNPNPNPRHRARPSSTPATQHARTRVLKSRGTRRRRQFIVGLIVRALPPPSLRRPAIATPCPLADKVLISLLPPHASTALSATTLGSTIRCAYSHRHRRVQHSRHPFSHLSLKPAVHPRAFAPWLDGGPSLTLRPSMSAARFFRSTHYKGKRHQGAQPYVHRFISVRAVAAPRESEPGRSTTSWLRGSSPRASLRVGTQDVRVFDIKPDSTGNPSTTLSRKPVSSSSPPVDLIRPPHHPDYRLANLPFACGAMVAGIQLRVHDALSSPRSPQRVFAAIDSVEERTLEDGGVRFRRRKRARRHTEEQNARPDIGARNLRLKGIESDARRPEAELARVSNAEPQRSRLQRRLPDRRPSPSEDGDYWDGAK